MELCDKQLYPGRLSFQIAHKKVSSFHLVCAAAHKVAPYLWSAWQCFDKVASFLHVCLCKVPEELFQLLFSNKINYDI